MNFSILHWFHLMFGNHTKKFCHAVIVGKTENSGEAVSKRLFYIHHVNIMQCMQPKLFIDWSSVPHTQVECAGGRVDKNHDFFI